MNLSSRNSLAGSTFFGLRPLAAVVLIFTAAAQVHALPNAELPLPQREWEYYETRDVVTGDRYPIAFLMSRNIPAPTGKTTGIGHGFLSVGNYKKRPMEVAFSWDAPPEKADDFDCKTDGCQLTIRFGTAPANKFIAIKSEHSSELVLQDGRSFIAMAIRHTGPVEVQFQTIGNGLATYRFSTTSRLQMEKLVKPSK